MHPEDLVAMLDLSNNGAMNGIRIHHHVAVRGIKRHLPRIALGLGPGLDNREDHEAAFQVG
jgi:hypothetical protein